MNEVVEVCCVVKQSEENKEEFILYPKTKLDKASLCMFLDDRGRYVNVRLMNRAQSKTYEQQKAFFALAALHFRAFNGGKAPTSKELDYWYKDLLVPELFPVRPDSVTAGKFVSKTVSECTKEEMIDIIEKMLTLVAEAEGVPDNIELECKDIFEWVIAQKREQEKLEQERPMENIAEDLEALASSALDIF